MKLLDLLPFVTSLIFLGVFIWYLSATHPKTRRISGVWTIFAALLTCVLSTIPPSEKIKLGLDLQGGTAYLVKVENSPTQAGLEQAISVIRKRLDAEGGRNVIIQPLGADRINVQIPGTDLKQREVDTQALSRVARLEFKKVHPENEKILQKAAANHNRLPTEYAFDWELLDTIYYDRKGNEILSKIVVKRQAELSGKNVARAFRTFDEMGLPAVALRFDRQGASLFTQLTADLAKQRDWQNNPMRLAIVLDKEVRSAPQVDSIIGGGEAIIKGGRMNATEAEQLASILENPLENPVEIQSIRTVDPSLGQDSIQSGWQAGSIALIAVVIFMVLYYRVAGVVAVLAMAANLCLLLGMLAQFHFTLTLPGIAGIILTIGMAVDANVLIYERIRDEIKQGSPLRQAVDLGFDRAFSAIVDSNITTLIAAVVLGMLGSGPLRGFAITLTLGILANLFTALVVSRVCFEWLLYWKPSLSLNMMKFLSETHYNFLRWRWAALLTSLIIISIGAFLFQQKGAKLMGVDFIGGDSVIMSYQTKKEVGDIRQALQQAGIEADLIQYAKNSRFLTFQTRLDQGSQAADALIQTFPQAGFRELGIDTVGPQVSGETKNRAIVAIALGLLGILIYAAFRFEWPYAVAATLGQLHDVAFVLGAMALLGHQLTLLEVAALLAIAGYSINDKIVIFDRIREALRLHEKGTLAQTINRGLNRSLARTLLTSGTTLLATLALMILGGPVIYDFSLAIFIGVIAGTYSSNMISPALAYWIHPDQKQQKKAS